MSELLVTSIYNQEGEGAPSFPKGATVTGVITATSFSGSGANLTGIDATALKDDGGVVKIQANSDGAVVTGILTTTGPVTIGGTLTYEDVTNIDSVGIITARDGLKVTGGNLNVGTAITAYGSTGIVSATSYRGDGSQLSGIEAAPTAQLVTSENLVAGDTVSIKSNGQVEKITSNVTQVTPLQGSNAEVSGSPDGDESSSALDPFNPTKCYEIHCHQNNQVYSRIGTIVGNSLDVGANVAWSNKGDNISPITSNSNDAVSLCNIGSGKYLAVVGGTTAYARVVNVNYAANTVSPENGYATLNGGNDVRRWDVDSYGTDKAVITYYSHHDSSHYVVGVSVSGNTVTLGTPVQFNTGAVNTGEVNVRRLGSTSKFLTTWYKDTSDGLLCRMGNLDTSTNTVTTVGTEITIEAIFGTAVGTTNALTYTKDNKWISVWKSVSGYFKGAVISYDGNTTITRGTILQISGNQTDHNCLVYDTEGDRTIALYEDRDSGSGSLRIRALTVSGTTLTASAQTELSGQTECYICRRGAFYAPYWGVSFGICEQSTSNRLFKFMIRSATITTNSSDFLGFVGSSFSATSTATIQVVGNINANQSGLTPGLKYYVQKDGSILPDEANPSIYAGRALSATSLLIKG